jgi:hypothetical protein
MPVASGSHSNRGRAAFMLLDTAPTRVALSCTAVLGVTRLPDWNAPLPIPFGTLIPVPFASSEPLSVVQVCQETRSLAILISGAIRIEHLPATALLSMSVLRFRGFELFSEVVLVKGRPSALVVNIDALLRLHQEIGS